MGSFLCSTGSRTTLFNSCIYILQHLIALLLTDGVTFFCTVTFQHYFQNIFIPLFCECSALLKLIPCYIEVLLKVWLLDSQYAYLLTNSAFSLGGFNGYVNSLSRTTPSHSFDQHPTPFHRQISTLRFWDLLSSEIMSPWNSDVYLERNAYPDNLLDATCSKEKNV